MKKLFLFVLTFILINGVQSQPYPYTCPVTFTNNTGTSYYNHQSMFHFFTSTFIGANMMRPDGGDIRMYRNAGLTIPMDYYIEGYLNTDSTRIWVKLDTLPANSSVTIYINFGNLAATPMSTLSIFDGPHSSTDSISGGSTTNLGDAVRSFRFTANQNLLVTNFGKNEPSGGQRYLTLWNYNTQQIIKQTQVDGPPATWSYDTLDQAIWLQGGSMYLMSIFIPTGAQYSWQVSSQIGQHLTYHDMRYCNSCTQNTFPTTVLTGYQYGYSDFLYYTRNGSYNPGWSISPVTNIGNGNNTIPDRFAIHQNYPNPFNPTTKINYDIASETNVKLSVFDVLGREIETLVNEYKTPGSYTAVWNASGFSSGIYFCKIETDNFNSEIKMLVVK